MLVREEGGVCWVEWPRYDVRLQLVQVTNKGGLSQNMKPDDGILPSPHPGVVIYTSMWSAAVQVKYPLLAGNSPDQAK